MSSSPAQSSVGVFSSGRSNSNDTAAKDSAVTQWEADAEAEARRAMAPPIPEPAPPDLSHTIERFGDKVDQLSHVLGEYLEEVGAPDKSGSSEDESICEEPISFADLADEIAQLKASVTALIDAPPAGAEQVDLAAVIEPHFATLTETLEAVAARPLPQPDLATQRQHNAQFLTAMTHFCSRQEASLERMEQRTEPLQGEIEQLKSSIAAFINEAPAPAEPIDLAAVIEPHFSALTGTLEAIAARPLPQPDLTAQRQHNAQFLTAMTQFCSRQQASLERMEERTEPLQDEIAQLKSSIATLNLDQPAPAGEVDLTAAIEPHFAAFAQTLEAMAARPLPQPDLTAQRRQIAQFLTAMTHVSTRLESSWQRLEQRADPLFDEIAELKTHVEAIKTDQHAPAGQIDLAAEIAPHFAAFTQTLEEMASRPLPQPDLTAQRQQNAQFLTAMTRFSNRQNAFWNRLEQRMDAFEARLSEQEGTFSQAAERFQEDVQTHNKRVEQAQQSFERHAAQAQDQLKALTEGDGLGEKISGRLADAISKGDTEVDPGLIRDVRIAVAELMADRQRLALNTSGAAKSNCA